MYNLSYQSPQLRVAVIARAHYREVQTKAERNKLHVIEQKVVRHIRPLVAFIILSQHTRRPTEHNLMDTAQHGI